MLFGAYNHSQPQNGVQLASGPTQTYENITAMNGYPVLGGVNQNGNYSDTYVVVFPNAGQYDFEIDYFQWENNQNLVLQMAPYGSTVFAPIPIANGTNLQSMATAPTWTAWTTTQHPAYPSVTEQGTYTAPGGQYAPTGGALPRANHGPASDFVWQASKNFTLPNTTIVDPTGNMQAPYRTGYSGTSVPAFSLTFNALTNDNTHLQWINEGGAAGLITEYAYNADGVLSQVTDPARNVTTYSSFTCGNLLPQITTLPADAAGKQLTSTSQWNCNIAAIIGATDANGNTQTWTYGDPLIRPTQYVNQAGTTTTTAYATNTVETTTNFKGAAQR
jgi:YD repeat-containing protein